MKITAEEFRKVWLQENPNIIHIPSEHEILLMESYANFRVYELSENKKIKKVKINVDKCAHTFVIIKGIFRCSKCRTSLGQWMCKTKAETL